ncbi:hypothetical protein KKJ09_19380 [Xenorhabdus bovienii]|uniref:hypothetical protein n=1 Tax=Xenorhabdus bovienii TaxID=40576 RepID=UPI0023B2DC3D|nr:hypothetical protein [Xenorhabdus bovienii]MDE9495684.1 hypothetical protein [Xenorhabdus bovienii]MDE9504076.1 hypothetical protein [Xenorhabdus bovienii]MDE9527858.1 hypothetical protein [Xenorhabdus bovienii]MDE9571196.1 hypothetical protein [Xenorhabdus bovienii]
MRIVKSNQVVIMYRTATQVSRVSNELAGGFMYFANAQDAMDTGLFCQKLVFDYWSGDERFDFLDKPFAIKNWDELTPKEKSIVNQQQ